MRNLDLFPFVNFNVKLWFIIYYFILSLGLVDKVKVKLKQAFVLARFDSG